MFRLALNDDPFLLECGIMSVLTLYQKLNFQVCLREKKTIEAAALLSICAVSGFDGSLLKLVRRLLFQ